MKILLTFLLSLFLTPVMFGQTLSAEISTYIRHHKNALISDGVIFAAWEADAFSSIHCQKVSRGCIEQNKLLGNHPSNVSTITYATGMAGVTITSLHLIDYLLKNDPTAVKIVRWFPTAAFAGVELFNVKNNADVAEFFQNQQKARARLK